MSMTNPVKFHFTSLLFTLVKSVNRQKVHFISPHPVRVVKSEHDLDCVYEILNSLRSVKGWLEKVEFRSNLNPTNLTNFFFIANPSTECRHNGATWRFKEIWRITVYSILGKGRDPLITRGVKATPVQLNLKQEKNL